MFETSVIQARAQVAGGRYSLLTISLIAHSAVVVGIVAFSIASVEFPVAAPDAYEDAPVFLPIVVPPPLGRPDAGGPEPQPQRQVAVPVRPVQDAAPNQIPDEVIPVESASNVTSDATGPTTGEPGPIGDPDGVKDSVADPNSIVVGIAPPVEPKIYQPYEVKAPGLLHRVDPVYPQAFVRIGIPATVVVRCVIGKDGQVRSPEVVVSGRKPFDDAVIAALQQWRYTPASLRGVAVDSYLDVTVNFTLRR